jgi:hypothetical protein
MCIAHSCRYPSTVATLSRRARDVVEQAFMRTSDLGKASPLVSSRLQVRVLWIILYARRHARCLAQMCMGVAQMCSRGSQRVFLQIIILFSGRHIQCITQRCRDRQCVYHSRRNTWCFTRMYRGSQRVFIKVKENTVH